MRITAAGVQHRYSRNGPFVLNGVDLTISDDSESIALMGPSGSGKTTLLSIMGGLLRPTEGSVSVDDLDQSPASVTSWIHQITHGLGSRTVGDNSAIGAIARGQSRREARSIAREMLELVGLGGRESAIARTLSGGEMQRLAIARSLAKGDPFLMADEPTGQLDKKTGDRVLDALFAAVANGTSLVVATHDPDVALRCSTVWHVADGKLMSMEST